MIKIFIPTYKRDEVKTLEEFPKEILKNTFIVVQYSDRDRLPNLKYVTKLVLPKKIKTIAPTREWIGHYCLKNKYSKFVMIDDDLKFFRRIENSTKLRQMKKSDFKDMFTFLEKSLDKYFHAGISAREGNNHIEEQLSFSTRMMRVTAYRTKMYCKLKHCRLPVMEDFDVTLQLLKKGFENIVSFEFANNQRGSGATGGCSEFRTLELQKQCAVKLAKLHSPYVTVVKKKTKTAWNGEERYDVRVQWKKAAIHKRID